MKGNTVKKGIWGLIFTLLCIPMIQHCFDIIGVMPLRGNYNVTEKVTFTKDGWWEGSYQEKKNKEVNDYTGFRPDLVRLSNQVDFSMFNIARGAIMGRKHYLFYDNYINVSSGRAVIEPGIIREELLKLKYLQDAFSREHKTFLFVEPPMKTDFFPEFVYGFPSLSEIGVTNHKAYKMLCDSLGINHIDISSVFLQKKGKIEPVLFTKQGTHWSMYGAMYAVDTIIKLIEKDRNIDLANPEWSTYEVTDVPRKTDNDIGETLNLIFPIKERFYYPNIKFPHKPEGGKPSAVYIGDSFTWTLMDDSLMVHTHSAWEFWYYFNTVFTQKSRNGEEPNISIPDYDWKSKLDAVDCVIMVFVPTNYNDLNRCVDSIYNYYKGKEQNATGKRPKPGK